MIKPVFCFFFGEVIKSDSENNKNYTINVKKKFNETSKKLHKKQHKSTQKKTDKTT